MNGDGSIIAVGSSTFHVVIEFSGTDWVQRGNAISCPLDQNGMAASAVAISSNRRFLVTACAADDTAGLDAGIVGVWEYINNGWSNRQVFSGESPGDRFGQSVAISYNGVLLVVGAPYRTGNETEVSDIEGFGWSVALSNEWQRLIVGAPGDDSSVAFNIGQAFVFEFLPVPIRAYLATSRPLEAEGLSDLFGYAVATNGDGSIYAIGGPANTGRFSIYSGHVRVFRRGGEDETLVKMGSDIDGPE
ncbi:Inherit from bactNOG: outer membrane autotransporter barrel [Seminavis robusta]|uniref:Inherit from bactNOG: outer membrane autotransporter barrel n=1 Tax=Seminavis robusta TaxID=568900 RepID=A0A9N8EKV4_9STRA|nr:Inherit from bactNOG: outer membrane autotransporter barrel [Seminavis robusta]|eukprot:Sro1251_g256140.1 Inherit from bactNOG: outer membrane autotransporter barrel (246) ;mRNA; r:7397-8329